MKENNQLVVFGLNNQHYGLQIENVSEIIRIMEITRVPNTQYYCKGIINLRGAIVPVISLSLRLGLEENKLGRDSRIIVTETIKGKLGLIVDSVYSVTRYSNDEVEKSETMNGEDRFIKGILKEENDMILLLNLKEVMED
ncbi:chemotaxis protein CheW [Desulfoscipio gibsoniae]|uniref:Chemotaxis signal transduction protein n=1 Tax=Desulfoscipio gibsoniae DSM 7213 TaxID=767817 RepID=R4KME9_9FIRM|nr:chemotaxis protein CheW [Desulfoscipio gibsoniae]AGL01710.1 chemotaxis signal transduction protein [Desulfoscipio gibsoniae DSM 7213]